MNIEIHQLRLEALIQERMSTGQFETIEDLLLQSLELSPPVKNDEEARSPRQDLDGFMRQSPLWGSGLEIARGNDLPRPVDL